jgi:hypothetical protein
MKQAVLGYEQKFFIDGTQIHGVQSVDGSYSISEKPINILGWGHVNSNFYKQGLDNFTQPDGSFILDENGFNIIGEQTLDCARQIDGRKVPESMAILNSPLEGSFSIDSILVSEDFFIQYTGDRPFNGSIHHGNKYFGFSDGYINNHTISCSVGQLPTTSTSITVFGDVGGSPDYVKQDDGGGVFLQENEGFRISTEDSSGGGYNASGENSFPEIRLTNQGSIIIECDGSSTDRVTSFSHSIEVPLSPIYTVGSSVPAQVDVIWPTMSTTSFNLDIDEYQYQSMRKYLRNPHVKDISVTINDCFGRLIQKYIVKSARLMSETMASSTGGRMTVNLSYKSYYNKR